MIEYDQAEQGENPNEELGVKVIGIGGAGSNVLDRMALEGSDDAELLTLNTDVRALSTSVSGDKIQLGATLLKGMGAGGDPSLGKQAALEAVDEIREAVRSRGMVFLCVGLGGGTGSGAAPEICRIAREEGCFLVVFATMPFSFEGERRMSQAREALEKVGRYANAVITFENDRMGELIVPKDGVTQAFAAADKIISQSIRATMNLAFRPGIIRIGMDDLLAALDSKHSRCLFGYGVAKGENRSHEAVEQALKCPLLDRGKLLEEARTVLIQVAGGETMTLYEVQLVMEEMHKHVGRETQILFGTGSDKRLGSSLSVTVISSISDPNASDEEDTDEEVHAPVSLGMAPESPLAAASATEVAGEEAVAPEAPVVPPDPPPLEATEPEPPMESEELEAEPGLPDTGEAMEGGEPVPPEAPTNDSAIFEPLDEEEGEPPVEEPFEPVEPQPAYAPQHPEGVEHAPEFSENAISHPEEGAGEYADPRNPIARAMEGGGEPESPASPPDVESHAGPHQSEEPPPPAANESQPPGDVHPEADRIEAVTGGSQKIRLTRVGSGGETGDEASLPTGGDEVAGPPSLSPEGAQPPEEDPVASEAARQQQEMLQLEPVSSDKGRFAKGDPTIVDGEDLDVPTFLRKGQ